MLGFGFPVWVSVFKFERRFLNGSSFWDKSLLLSFCISCLGVSLPVGKTFSQWVSFLRQVFLLGFCFLDLFLPLSVANLARARGILCSVCVSSISTVRNGAHDIYWKWSRPKNWFLELLNNIQKSLNILNCRSKNQKNQNIQSLWMIFKKKSKKTKIFEYYSKISKWSKVFESYSK